MLRRTRSDQIPAQSSAASKSTTLRGRRDAKRGRPRCLRTFSSRHPSGGSSLLYRPPRAAGSLSPPKKTGIHRTQPRPSAARGNFLRTYATAGAPPRPPTSLLRVPGTPPRLASGSSPEAGRGRTLASQANLPARLSQSVTPADAPRKRNQLRPSPTRPTGTTPVPWPPWPSGACTTASQQLWLCRSRAAPPV